MSQKRVFNQFVHTLSYGDAISSEVLALKRAFNEMGHSSEIYALNVHPKLKGQATVISAGVPESSDEMILHYSLGSPLNQRYLEAKNAKRTLIYHNLTPPHWFVNINPRIAADVEVGIKELPHLCAVSDRLVADSKFNASELEQIGFRAAVLDLPVDPNRWQVATNGGIKRIVQEEGGIHVLHVGRIVPNKCIEDIIKSFYFLNKYIEKNSRLWLVGIDIDTELYSFGLKRLVHNLNLEERVNFAGCMADSEVRALYESCSVYLCMSEHEGFCLPVVEAMYFGLPVVAYASSALPETIGKGGVLVAEKRHPEIAELINKIAGDPALRAKIVAEGQRRVEQLSYERFSGAVRSLFDLE